MHILLIHQIFNTPEDGGGTRHYELGKYLVQKGHRVTVIASNIDYLTGRRKNRKKETKDGIDIVYANTFQAVHRSFLFRALSFLSFAFSSFVAALKVNKIDVIWGTSPPLFQSLTTLFISKIMRKPFLFEVRDLWIDFAVELGIVKNRLIIWAVKLLEKMLYKFSDKIVVNSPGFIPFITKYITEDKISLIPNGVITGDFHVDKKTINFRSQHNLDDKFIAIYLGNIGVANDIETIIETAETLRKSKDIVFVLMGGGIKKDEYKDDVKKRNLSNIMVLDAVPKSQVPEILSEVDVCIATLRNIPLFSTTYPNKVFDYMAAQKPTILAIDGVMRKVIEDCDGGIYVTPGDSTNMADTVLKYYNSPELKNSHGINARKHVVKYFEREEIANGLEQVMMSLHRES